MFCGGFERGLKCFKRDLRRFERGLWYMYFLRGLGRSVVVERRLK